MSTVNNNLLELAIVTDPLLGAPLPLADGSGQLRVEVVFIESDVKDIEVLLKGIDPDKEVHVLDAGTDGLQQMAAILSGRTGIDALHVLSHGSAGTVNLGSLLLNHDNLSVHQSELQSIGQSLKSDADILLYGCDIGAGNGAHLLDDLALITGADLAASNNITGASTLGGDWVLEVHAGNIETAPVVDAALSQLYSSVLAPFPGITFNTGANFVSYGGPLASDDVIYKVSGNSANQLKIDGTQAGVDTFAFAVGSGYASLETAVTFSFLGRQTFSATSLYLRDAYGRGQVFIFKGYDANNSLMVTTPPSPAGLISLGMTGVAKIVMTAMASPRYSRHLIALH